MNRTEYNKIRYDFTRKQHNILETFKKENPVKYAELMSKAQDENKKEEAAPYLTLTTSSTPHLQIGQNNINRLEKLLRDFAGTRKDYYIYVEIPRNGWSETHTLFEMLNDPTNEQEIRDVIRHHYSDPNLIIKKVEKCQCPACV